MLYKNGGVNYFVHDEYISILGGGLLQPTRSNYFLRNSAIFFPYVPRSLEIIPYFLDILPSSQARIIKKIGSMSQVIFSISPNRIVEWIKIIN